nr:antitoxin Xre/MbcA/ParS toxin-binding domain-containing protein [Brucella pituitosa]
MSIRLSNSLTDAPARGISTIIDIIGSHRIAWLWLRQVNPVLGGRKPIDCLKQERLDEVIDVARAYFEAH